MPGHPAAPATAQDPQTLQRLEGAVRLAVDELKALTGFDGFVLDMPAGPDRPPHLIVVGTAAEIAWLLAQRAARPGEREQH
jgi:hypothetical protein